MKWREAYIYICIYIHSFYIPYSHRSGGDFLQSQLSVLYGYISPVTNPEAHINPLPSPILVDLFTPSRNTARWHTWSSIRRYKAGHEKWHRQLSLRDGPRLVLLPGQRCCLLKRLGNPVACLLTMSAFILTFRVRIFVTLTLPAWTLNWSDLFFIFEFPCVTSL